MLKEVALRARPISPQRISRNKKQNAFITRPLFFINFFIALNFDLCHEAFPFALRAQKVFVGQKNSLLCLERELRAGFRGRTKDAVPLGNGAGSPEAPLPQRASGRSPGFRIVLLTAPSQGLLAPVAFLPHPFSSQN